MPAGSLACTCWKPWAGKAPGIRFFVLFPPKYFYSFPVNKWASESLDEPTCVCLQVYELTLILVIIFEGLQVAANGSGIAKGGEFSALPLYRITNVELLPSAQ